MTIQTWRALVYGRDRGHLSFKRTVSSLVCSRGRVVYRK